MMKIELFEEADKIWRRMTKDLKAKNIKFEIETYREILNFFMAGDYYYYIFNVKDVSFDFMSEEITKVLGYPVNQVDVSFFVSKIHPEDQPWFLNFENKVAEFFGKLSPDKITRYKVRYDYRVKKSTGDYIRVLQQVITIQTEGGRVIRTLGVHTDISHLKEHGVPVLSFIGLQGEPSFVDIKADRPFKTNKLAFTKREYEILGMIAQGKKSEEISKKLFISKQTVTTHRRNIMFKSGCKNVAELTSMGMRKGWI